MKMGNGMEWEIKILKDELEQGRELTKQLKNHLSPSLSSPEKCQLLIQMIQSSYDNALLSLLNWSSTNKFLGMSITSPTSPLSEGCVLDSKGTLSKKRKALARVDEIKRVCLENGQDGHYDGHSWRKYGQKNILGANHPRAYFRCTHLPTQNCMAKKQVQKSNEDPTILEISYRGTHTCNQASHLLPKIESPQQPTQNNEPEMLLDFGANLNEENKVLGPIFPFSSAPPIEGLGPTFTDGPNNFMDYFTPGSLSPATSESNYFSMSPVDHNMNNFGMGGNEHPCEVDLNDILNADFFSGDSNFSLDPMNFDTFFQFDNSDSFP